MTGKKPQSNPSLYGAAALMAGFTLLSRVLGLVREQVFAYFFGASAVTDAFQIAFRIPSLLRNLFAEGAMSSALVPVYSRVRHEEGEDSAWRLTSNVVTTLAVLVGGISFLGILWAGPLVSAFAPAFHEVPGKFELTVVLTRLLWPFLPLIVMAAVWMGVLNARCLYGVPALAPSLFNLISIFSAFTLAPLLTHLFGYPLIYGMAIGAVLGGLAQWLVQIPALRREGFRYRWAVDLGDPGLRRIVALIGAGTFGLAASQVNLLVNSVLAASQGDGAVSWLYYAFRLLQFPLGIFGAALSTATLTAVSQQAAAGNVSAVKGTVEDSLRMLITLTLPSSAGLAVLGIPIISVIYQHGHFGARDTYQCSLALAGYALGLSALAGIKVMVPVLYSLGRARLTVWSSGLGILLNTALCLTLLRPLGFKGLALASSGAALLNAGILLWILASCLKQFDFKSLLVCAVKTLGSTLFMAIIVYVFLGFLEAQPFRPIPLTGVWDKANFATHLLYLFAALGLGIASFSLAGRLLRLHELEQIQGFLWKRLRIRKD